MKIIAFDQSTVKTGYAVMDGTDLVRHGVIDHHKVDDQWERSQMMFHSIARLIQETKPQFVVIEGVALQTNPQVLIKLGQLQGHIMALAWSKNLPVQIYLPTEWRKILGFKQGKGVKRKDHKDAAMGYVKQRYPIEVSEDEAEAISIALAFLIDTGVIPEENKEEK